MSFLTERDDPRDDVENVEKGSPWKRTSAMSHLKTRDVDCHRFFAPEKQNEENNREKIHWQNLD